MTSRPLDVTSPDTAAISPPAAPAPGLRDAWLLDPDYTFLNHGSFGARLRRVAERQRSLLELFESRPVWFLDRTRNERIEEAKVAVGRFLRMEPGDFGLMTNASEGINAILRSRDFAPGDEILTSTHAYYAVIQTMRYIGRRTGATPTFAEVPLPCPSPEAVVAAFRRAITPRTRLMIVDHVTSPTAIRFPVETLIALGAEHDVDVLVDGAHGPGMLDLDVEGLGAAYYVGNLHKWVCAPIGAGFLWVRPDRREALHPNVISHFLDEGLAAEFAWQGTRDITPWLCVAEAIDAMGALLGPESWPAIRRHNHALATWVQDHLATAWSREPGTPRDGSMLGSMVGMALPDGVRERMPDAAAAHHRLYDEHRIEVPVFDWEGRWVVRPCCQVYNTAAQYEQLANAVLSWLR